MTAASAGGGDAAGEHATDGVSARVDEILAKLRDNGGRLTTGRRAIVRALLTAEDHHVTAEELASAVQVEHPHVHLSTVYRTLDALEVIGVLDRVAVGPGGSVYHLAVAAHHHLVCTRCGSVVEVPQELVSSLADELERRYRFAIDRPHLMIPGLCEHCRPAI